MNLSKFKEGRVHQVLNPCPAEPGYVLPLQTVDPDQLVSEEAN